MIEAFKIGVALNMSSNAFGVLSELGQKFEAVERLMKAATDSMKGFERSLNGLASADKKIGDLQKRLTKISETKFGNTGDLGKMLTGTRELADAATILERAWKGTAEAMTAGARASGRMRLPSVGRGRRGGGGDGEDSGPWNPAMREAYPNAQWENRNRDQIARSTEADAGYRNRNYDLAMSRMDREAEWENRNFDQVRRHGERLASRKFRDDYSLASRMNADHDSAHKRTWGEHGDLAMSAMAAGSAGVGVLDLGTRALDRAMEVGHLRAQIMADRRVNAGQADAAVNAAYDAANKAPGTTVTKNLEALIDLKNVTGSLGEAEKILPQFAQLSAVLAVMDKRKGGSGDPAYAAAKAMEIMGQMIEEKVDPVTGQTTRDINPDMLASHLQSMARVAVATNNRVNPNEYLQFAKQARVAGMVLDDKFIYEDLPALLQTTGGRRIGTALMSTFQVFKGNSMMAKSYKALEDIGLADNSGIKVIKDGRHTREYVDTKGVYDLDLLGHNPLDYMQKAQARMEAAGIHGTENQIIALMKASQRSTIAGLLADLLKDMPSIQKEQQNIVNTKPDLLAHFAQNDPTQKLQQFNAAWDKLMTTLGGDMMPMATRILTLATDALNGLAAWAKANPGMATAITDTAAALGVLAAAIGGISAALWLYMPAFKLVQKLLSKGDIPNPTNAPELPPGPRSMTGLGKFLGAAGEAYALYSSTKGVLFGSGRADDNGLTGLFHEVGPSDGKHFNVWDRNTWANPQGSMWSAAPPPSVAPNTVIKGDVNLDGKKVGTWLGQAQAKSIAKPQTGMTGFDPSQAAMYQAIPGGF